MKALASAPGKVILLGEHAVVHGQAALAAAIQKKVTVEVAEDSSGPRVELPGGIHTPAELIEGALEIAAEVGAPSRFRTRIESELPLGAGLGSSAAVGVALARALSAAMDRPCGLERAAALALRFERRFHGAPSGIDPAVCARGGVLLFTRGEPEQIEEVRPPRPIFLAVALTGIARGTRSTVLPLSARRAERPALYDPLLAFLGELARSGKAAVERGDLTDLGVRFDAAHGVLGALGVSCVELEGAVRALREAGALGAKLTGAGGGGAAIGLARDAEHAARIVASLREAGLQGFVAEIGR